MALKNIEKSPAITNRRFSQESGCIAGRMCRLKRHFASLNQEFTNI